MTNLWTLRIGILSMLLASACTKHFVPLNLPCPPRPQLQRVHLQNGSLAGVEVQKVIQNQLLLWKHIHLIETSGCIASQ